MRLIKLTQQMVAMIDDEDYELVSQYKWRAHKSKSAYPNAPIKYYARGRKPSTAESVYMHRLILQPERGQEVDHIDRNGLNNRRCNLRLVTSRQNKFNCSGKRTSQSSSYKGVSWSKAANKWVARIKIDKKNLHLGVFIEEIDAAKAYNEAASKHWGEFACLNQIQ